MLEGLFHVLVSFGIGVYVQSFAFNFVHVGYSFGRFLFLIFFRGRGAEIRVLFRLIRRTHPFYILDRYIREPLL